MDKLKSLAKLQDRILFNFLAADRENAEEVMEASDGYAVPGIVAADFTAPEEAAARVEQLKEVTPVVSVGLGGGGDASRWRQVLDIGLLSDPGHLNQPFHCAAYTRGAMDQAGKPQYINGLIAPSGKQGIVRLAGDREVELGLFLEMASLMQLASIKVMPMKGLQHLDELVHIAEQAASFGIYGIEPAGGIHADNIVELITALLKTNIPFIMPHIFGNTIDPHTGRTLPVKVREIVHKFD